MSFHVQPNLHKIFSTFFLAIVIFAGSFAGEAEVVDPDPRHAFRLAGEAEVVDPDPRFFYRSC